jgi:hypothetical protein
MGVPFKPWVRQDERGMCWLTLKNGESNFWRSVEIKGLKLIVVMNNGIMGNYGLEESM